MSEKFKKIVNAPHRAMGRLRERVQYTRPESKGGRAARVMGIGATGMFEFLLWAAKYLTLDNHAIRKMEQVLADIQLERGHDAKNSKMTVFMKKNPDLAAHMIYYLMAAMTLGGVAVYNNVAENNDSSHIKTASAAKAHSLNPAAANFMDQCIAMENLVCIPLVYAETYRETPKVQYNENVWTRGYGMTWSRDKNGRMKIRDYADTPANRRRGFVPHKPTVHRTKDQDIEESQQFLIDHVYPKIKSYMSREITEGEFYALCVAGYQLEGHMKTICQQLGAATTQQQIADAFITPTMYNYGGTPKRRWVCGMLAAGLITLDDVLNADIDGFYGSDTNTFIRNGHFICDANTINYVLGLKRKKSTRAEISELADGKKALAQLKSGTRAQPRTVIFDNSAEGKKIEQSMGNLLQAQKKFDAGDFKASAKLYEDAISTDPDNMEAYSSLALAYKRQGDKDKSIEYYEKSCNVVKRCNARMNANKALLMDYDVKASSYFNAGIAREAMADIYKTKGDMASARRNYDLAAKNFRTARENCLRGNGSKSKLNVYDDAIQRVGKKGKSKQTAFAKGVKSIKNNTYASDMVVVRSVFDAQSKA